MTVRPRLCLSALCLPALALLAGCASEVGYGPEAASFGAADANNALIQSAAFQRGALLSGLQARFAAETPATVTFEFDRATLDAAARAALDRQAAWLLAESEARVRIVGHADLVGGESYNDRLGLRRARAAARYLVARGVERSRIDAVESRGETEPAVATEGPERRNRRAETAVAGLVHGYVGDGMDGRRALLMYTRYATDQVEPPATADTASGGSGGSQ